MLLILKICLSFLLLIWTSGRTANALEFILILLLLSLDKWGNLRDHIWRWRIRSDLTRCSRRALASTLRDKSWSTMNLCTHYRHAGVLIHCGLLVLLKLAREAYSWRSALTNSSKIWADTFITHKILMRNITELSMMLLISKIAIVELLLQGCLSLA